MTVKIYSLPSDAMSPPVAEGFVTDFVLASDYADLQRKVEALAAENDRLDTFIKVECWTIDDIEDSYVDAADTMPETPTTDAELADFHDRFINDAVAAISESGAQTVGDAIVAVASMRKESANEKAISNHP